MRNRETCSQMPYNLVFNTILRYFRYDITPYSAVNKCYRRSLSWLTGGVVLDENVAFATGFGSSTHHTQSPNHNLAPITTQPDLTSSSPTITPPNLTTLHTAPSHIPSYSHPHQNIPSIYLSIHTHPYTDAYTLTRSIVNKLLTLHIPIDILTYIWYNKNNGKGLFS